MVTKARQTKPADIYAELASAVSAGVDKKLRKKMPAAEVSKLKGEVSRLLTDELKKRKYHIDKRLRGNLWGRPKAKTSKDAESQSNSKTRFKYVKIGGPKGREKGTQAVKFGNYRIVALAPSKKLIRSNVAASGEALDRIAKRFSTSGFNLSLESGVPLYFADSDDPKVIIRQLDGKKERGHFVDGLFKTSSAD